MKVLLVSVIVALSTAAHAGPASVNKFVAAGGSLCSPYELVVTATCMHGTIIGCEPITADYQYECDTKGYPQASPVLPVTKRVFVPVPIRVPVIVVRHATPRRVHHDKSLWGALFGARR